MMDLEEYKKKLQIEPGDPELEAARNESLDHARAARASAEFERRLSAALNVPVSPDAADRVLSRVLGNPPTSSARRWLAVAASLVAVIAIAVVLVRSPEVGDLQAAFVEHLNHPEPMALASREPVAPSLADEALQLVGAGEADPGPKVTYVSRCVIGGIRGVHMVLTDDQSRKTTLLFVPDRQVVDATQFRSDGRPARLFGTRTGAVAVFGHGGQSPDPVIRSLFGARPEILAFRS